MLFAGIVKSSEVVLVHDSGGRELMLKPGLNIIGGVQPRGVNEVIAGDMFGILVAVDIVGMLESPDMLDMDMAAAVTLAASEGDEVEVGVVATSEAIEPIAIPGLGLNPRPVPA